MKFEQFVEMPDSVLYQYIPCDHFFISSSSSRDSSSMDARVLHCPHSQDDDSFHVAGPSRQSEVTEDLHRKMRNMPGK
jgi:hypothetical protein